MFRVPSVLLSTKVALNLKIRTRKRSTLLHPVCRHNAVDFYCGNDVSCVSSDVVMLLCIHKCPGQ